MADALTFQKIFSDAISQMGADVGVNMTIGAMLLSLFVSFLLAGFIYLVYKKTYSGVMYNRNFSITLIMTALIVTGIMMTITGNLALSLGMVGALSIIRFRTAIKDPKDVTFLFWAVSIGIMNGVAFYQLSITLTAFMSILMVLLSKKAPSRSTPYVLMVKCSRLEDQQFEEALKNNCKSFRTRNISIDELEGEKTLEVRVKKGRETDLLREIKAIKGVKKAALFSHEGELAD